MFLVLFQIHKIRYPWACILILSTKTMSTVNPWKWPLALVLTQPHYLPLTLGLLPSDHLPGFIQGKCQKGKAEAPMTVKSITLQYHQVLHITIQQMDSTRFTLLYCKSQPRSQCTWSMILAQQLLLSSLFHWGIWGLNQKPSVIHSVRVSMLLITPAKP